MLFSCENKINEVKEIPILKEFPAETIYNIELYYTEYGKQQVKLSGPVLERYSGEKPYTKFAKGLHVEFYDSDMNVESEIYCKYAIRNENEKTMEGKDSVVVKNIKGEQFSSEHLIWDEQKDIIHTDKMVTIKTKDEIIWGEGMVSNTEFTKYKINKIRGRFNIDEKKKL